MLRKVLFVHPDEFSISLVIKKFEEKGFMPEFLKCDHADLDKVVDFLSVSDAPDILLLDQFVINLPIRECIRWAELLQKKFTVPHVVILRHDDITWKWDTNIQLVDFVRTPPEDIVRYLTDHFSEIACRD